MPAREAPEPTRPCRVLIADDHTVTRSGLRTLIEIEAGFEVVAEATNGHEAIEGCREHQPDVVLMDLQMPEMDGLEAIPKISEEFPGIAILVLTVQEDEGSVIAAVRAGAAGYLPKSASSGEVIAALSAVRSGDTYMAPSIASVAMRSLAGRKGKGHEGLEPLTPREQEVLELIAAGRSAKAIAQHLRISERTVNTHTSHLYRKLNVNTRVDAVLVAMQLGLVRPPG